MKLTTSQLATLCYVHMKGDITAYHPYTGFMFIGGTMLKNLVALNLLVVHDTSYGNNKTTWTVSAEGKALAKSKMVDGYEAMVKMGWIDEDE